MLLCYLKKRKEKNLISRTLAHFSIDSGMKLFFPTLFLFISKKLHHLYHQHIFIYICDSCFIVSKFFSPFYVFLVFLFVLSNSLISYLQISKSKKYFTIFSNSKKVTTCMVKKPYTFKSKNFYQLQFFFLISRLFTIQFPGVLLFIFIIKFYLIDNTYEYNKLLLV